MWSILKILLVIFLLSGSFILTSAKKNTRQTQKDSSIPEAEETNPKREKSVIPVPKCRHNFHENTEAGLNMQITMFLQAELVYSSMAQYFSSCSVALPGFSKFFDAMAKEQDEKADSLKKYQTLRGGNYVIKSVTSPINSEWNSGLEAMTQALEMEKSINAALLEVYTICTRNQDPHSAMFIQSTFLGPQVEKIYKLSQYVTNLERLGPGLGEYLFDKLPQS